MKTVQKRSDKLERWVNLLYILPTIAVFAVFILFPIIDVFRLSFYNIRINGTEEFIFLDNYIRFFQSNDALLILRNSAVWVFVGTAGKVLLGLIMALILYKNFRGKKVLTGVMLIPYAMPAAVACMVWRLMYNPTFGHIPQILLDLGLIDRAVSFLGSPGTSLLPVMLVNIWACAPFCALNILASLYAIPTFVYEAADIDGVGPIRKFFTITLPLILSDVRTLALLMGIWGFNSFDVIYMMTSGGPAISSSILVNYVYQNAFEFNNRGYSAAISIICFVLLSIFAVLYVRSKGKEVSYE